MTRKALIAAVTMIMLVFGALSLTAEAQTGQCYNCPLAYPGFASGQPTATAVPATPAPVATTAADATATNASDSSQIAFTGSESTVLGLAGASLIGVGAIALGARRKLVDDRD